MRLCGRPTGPARPPRRWFGWLPVGVVVAEWVGPPVMGGRLRRRIEEDAVDGAHGREALPATGTEFRHDDDVEPVVEDRAELGRTVTQAGVAVDADRHVND